MHSKLSKQSLSVLQPPCKIPQGLLGLQHDGLKVDGVVAKQFGLFLKLHVVPEFLVNTFDSFEAESS